MASDPLNIDGIDVFIEGDGADTVVMIHGWPDTHRLWDAQVELLKPHMRCVRFSLPGFDLDKPPRAPLPEEMAALFLKIVDAASPGRPVTLLLHDWGCLFGYDFAARHPQRVARVIGVDIGDASSRAYLRSLTAQAKLGIAFYQLWLAAAWKIGGSVGDRMTRWMATQLRYRAAPLDQVGAQMNYPYWLFWRGRLRGLKRFDPHCPMLYAYGRRKPFAFHSPAWEARIAQRPGSAVESFDTGHWVMVQAPQAFNARLAQWLGVEAAS